MATSLNRYRTYIDNNTKEGISLFNAALYSFQNPLEDQEKLTLKPKDAAQLVNIVNRLSNQFGYDFMIQNIPTTRTVTPGANAGDPDIITFGGHRNLLNWRVSSKAVLSTASRFYAKIKLVRIISDCQSI